jgi:2-polyprenyl-6-methoxyphenol hydroxylase-like FAD-dependent oxidoreductase
MAAENAIHTRKDQASASPGGTGHAVVIGGSMAGLLAARTLATHFEHVTVIERDVLPDAAEDRKGVPQGRQLHALLPRGLNILERLFPGYGEDLMAAGAVRLEVPKEVPILSPFGWISRRAAGWQLISASRPLFEATVRRRVRQVSGVRVLDRHEVTGPRASRNGRTVVGVTVRPVDSGGGVFDVDADLVVDASGRGSRAATWLPELGYSTPEQTQVNPDSAYASRVFRIPDGFTPDWKAVMLSSKPPSVPRSGYLFPIEHGQWMVACMGAAGQHPPTDDEGYASFVRSLRHPIIADAIADAEPVTPIRGHRGTTNRQWHFERMPRWPDGLVVLGDAVCAFNPIYGQGMTTAAVAADTLEACLQAHRRRHRGGRLEGFASPFQRQLARRNADPWMLSTGEDLRFPTTTGLQVNHTTRFLHRYLDRVVAACSHDQAVADAYVRVLGMLDRPTRLFSPRILAAAARTVPDGADISSLHGPVVPYGPTC